MNVVYKMILASASAFFVSVSSPYCSNGFNTQIV
jgi:hypothetical protein